MLPSHIVIPELYLALEFFILAIDLPVRQALHHARAVLDLGVQGVDDPAFAALRVDEWLERHLHHVSRREDDVVGEAPGELLVRVGSLRGRCGTQAGSETNIC